MSRGLNIERDDSRGPTSLRDHRRESVGRDRECSTRIEIRSLDRDRIPVERKPPEPDPRDAVRVRDEIYRLRQSEIDALQTIGTFRVVDEADLERFAYAGDAVRKREDLRSLREQGLVEQRSFDSDRDRRISVLTLTEEGLATAEQFREAGSEQELYRGFVKEKEIDHDAALYRMFQAEAAEIRANGGTIRRVQLDFQIKRELNRDLSKAAEEGPEAFEQAQRQVASRHGLRVIRGHVQVPDVRIEYESDQGIASRVSLELTTDHYKRAQISAKAQAGFRLYSLGGDSSGAGSPVRDEREITAGILSI